MNMTPERWKVVEQLFAEVKELGPADTGAFLRDKCGDDHELEREVVSLLQYHRSDTGLLESSPWEDLVSEAADAPTFEAGIAFGPYLIRSLLGSGGMGDVYLAEDTRLRRHVALKILRGWLSGPQPRLSRFTQEVLAASALNHPNVPVVYEAGEINRRHYIASEYVDGSPLTDRIAQGAIPWREAIALTLEIADALRAAHAAGIVHRDVKPANMLLAANDGRVKLVDFGVARLVEGAEHEPSARAPVTATGVVIGTPGYMAPEQAAGLKADSRSDIWSLAAVLHEMVTGLRPAPGTTRIKASSNLPSALARVLERALHPDREKRYQEMTEFAADLNHAQRSPRLSVRGPLAWSIAGIAAVAVLGLGWVFFSRLQGQGEPGFRAGQITRLTNNGSVGAAIISPDSRYVIYSVKEAGRVSLRLRQVDTGADVERVPVAVGYYLGLTFSPDGNYFYYTFGTPDLKGRSDLYRAPVLGGIAPQKVLENVDSAAAISPDGRQLAYFRGDVQRQLIELHTAEIDGSHDRVLASTPFSPRFSIEGGLAWSRDAQKVFCGMYDEHQGASLVSVAVPGGQRRVLSDPEWRLIGKISILSDDQTLIFPAVVPGKPGFELTRFSTKTHRWNAITSDDGEYIDAHSAGSDIVSVRSEVLSSVWIAPAHATAGARRITTPAGHYAGVVWSPDGTLVSGIADAGATHLFRLDRNGGAEQLTRGPFADNSPAVSPDGGLIAFESNRGGGIHIWTMNAGSGATQRLTTGSGSDSGPTFAPDGSILFTSLKDGAFREIGRIGKAGERSFPSLGWQVAFPAVSANGRYMVCSIMDRQSLEWHVAVADTLNLKELYRYPQIPALSLSEAPVPVKWLPGEMALTYVKDVMGVSNIWKLSLATGLETRLTDFREDLIFSFDWSQNTGELAMIRGIAGSDVVLIRRAK